MMKRKQQWSRGFSYLEIMTAIALFSLLLTFIFQFYSHQQKLLTHEIHKQDAKLYARTVINRTFLELSYASNLVIESKMVIMVLEDGEIVPIIDFSGYTQRGRLNYIKGEKHGMIVNEKGEIICDHIDDFHISNENDKLYISVTVLDHKNKPFTLKKTYYLKKL